MVTEYIDVWNSRDYAKLPSLLSTSFVMVEPGTPDGEIRGIDGTREWRQAMVDAFPDLTMRVDDLLVAHLIRSARVSLAMTTDIESVVSSWPGVEAGPHRFAGREFTLAGQEIGHLHGDRQADLPLPKRVRDIVVREGLTSKHHLYPESGWVTKSLRTE